MIEKIPATFEEYRTSFNRRFVRTAAILVAILMPAGMSLDFFTHPEKTWDFLVIRLISSLVALVVLAITYTPFLRDRVFFLGMIPVLSATIGIEIMILKLDGLASPYYAGLNLCIVGLCIAFYWKVHETILACSCIIGAWLLPPLVLGYDFVFSSFYNNFYFLFLNSIIAVTFTFIRTNMVRREYEAQKKMNLLSAQLTELDIAKSQFFSNISHELRTPLTLSMAPLQTVLKQATSLPDKLRESLRVAYSYQVKLANLVNDLLAFSKLEAGQEKLFCSQVDVLPFVSSVLEGFVHQSKGRGIYVEKSFPLHPFLLWVDKDKFEKIVMNLVSNAYKFTESGRIRVWLREAEGEAEFGVEDTGKGIPADKLDTIFERFAQVDASSTRRYQGTGIGLAMVKEYAEMHGGRVSVTSEVGKGSTFVVRFKLGRAHLPDDAIVSLDEAEGLRGAVGTPQHFDTGGDTGAFVLGHDLGETAVARAETSAEEVAALSAACARDMRGTAALYGKVDAFERKALNEPLVLVVDDNADLRAYIGRLLEGDARVILARDGAHALEIARAVCPDVIVSDVMMPEMSGDELCRAVKADPGDLGRVPVVLVTARADEQAKIKELDYGADEYLFKPFVDDELRIRVRNLLKRRRQDKALVIMHQLLSDKQEEMDADLRLARSYQERLLALPDLPPWLDVGAVFEPMSEVSGDFYVMHRVGPDCVRLLLSDITHHGVRAALRTMSIYSEFSFLDHPQMGPDDVLAVLNRVATQKYGDLSGSFLCVDMSLGEGDVLQLRYAQGGEAPMVKCSADGGAVSRFEESYGMVVGLIDDSEFELKTAELKPGERLVTYTDGLFAAENPAKESFHYHGLQEALAEAAKEPSAQACATLLFERLVAFQGRDKSDDDVTVLAFDYRGK